MVLYSPQDRPDILCLISVSIAYLYYFPTLGNLPHVFACVCPCVSECVCILCAHENILAQLDAFFCDVISKDTTEDYKWPVNTCPL